MRGCPIGLLQLCALAVHQRPQVVYLVLQLVLLRQLRRHHSLQRVRVLHVSSPHLPVELIDRSVHALDLRVDVLRERDVVRLHLRLRDL